MSDRPHVPRLLETVRMSRDERLAVRRDLAEVLLELAVATKELRNGHQRGHGAARIATYVDDLLGELDFTEPERPGDNVD